VFLRSDPHLKFTKRKSVNIGPFCERTWGLFGEEFKFSVQVDAAEFFNALINRVDDAASVFHDAATDTIACLECAYILRTSSMFVWLPVVIESRMFRGRRIFCVFRKHRRQWRDVARGRRR
jgi:hypothetical protein